MELQVRVRPDATVCLDLVLGHAGISYRALRVEPGGASLVVDLPESTDTAHIVAVLRQHLGIVLRCVVVDDDGRTDCLIHGSGN
jgi:hypothetical protein